jgi:hypothetical protein
VAKAQFAAAGLIDQGMTPSGEGGMPALAERKLDDWAELRQGRPPKGNATLLRCHKRDDVFVGQLKACRAVWKVEWMT